MTNTMHGTSNPVARRLAPCVLTSMLIIAAYIAAQIDWTCSLAALIILSLVFLVRMVELRSRRRDTQAILERKQSELQQPTRNSDSMGR